MSDQRSLGTNKATILPPGKLISTKIDPQDDGSIRTQTEYDDGSVIEIAVDAKGGVNVSSNRVLGWNEATGEIYVVRPSDN